MDTNDRSTTLAGDFDTQIRREWLITNGLGGFASGTIVGIPTRRYHGLLVSAARPPLERWLLLASVLERVTVCGRTFELAGFQFPDALHPRGFELLTDFEVCNASPAPWARFVYQHNQMKLTKTVVMPFGQERVVIRYKLEAPRDAPVILELGPFAAMRDFHSLTRAFKGGFAVDMMEDGGISVSGGSGWPRLWLRTCRTDGGQAPIFEHEPDWWYSFVYREESARGHDDREDLFTPGWFWARGNGSVEMELQAFADFSERGCMPPADSLSCPALPSRNETLSVEDRLRRAAGAFVVKRRCDSETDLTTILAGYHWFGDWGRDTFISLPGLLLETGRFDEARQVLKVFASAQQDGLIPNRFSDYGQGRDYNSVDASLWFIHAATVYYDLTGDQDAWREFLSPACERVIDAFAAGTIFNIFVDQDGLLSCGDESTQLTWMDAKCGNVVFTPRHGKPVEINALWYHDLCAMAERVEPYAPQRADHFRELAANAAKSFVPVFWHDRYRCLYDVVRDPWRDMSIRPNQIFAVSLPHSLLDDEQKRAVLDCVERELLTPYGLRSLAPSHPSYRGRYEGGPYERDSVYHQGTVWAWLIGPYIEAYLRVHGFSAEAKRTVRQRLRPLIEHLDNAGLGYVSEIFDGDEPHTPRGCIAQAWSVSELLRAWHMTEPERST